MRAGRPACRPGLALEDAEGRGCSGVRGLSGPQACHSEALDPCRGQRLHLPQQGGETEAQGGVGPGAEPLA